MEKTAMIIVLCLCFFSTKAQLAFPVGKDTNVISIKIWDDNQNRERWISGLLVCQQDGMTWAGNGGDAQQRCKFFKHLTADKKTLPKHFVVISAGGCPKRHSGYDFTANVRN